MGVSFVRISFLAQLTCPIAVLNIVKCVSSLRVPKPVTRHRTWTRQQSALTCRHNDSVVRYQSRLISDTSTAILLFEQRLNEKTTRSNYISPTRYVEYYTVGAAPTASGFSAIYDLVLRSPIRGSVRPVPCVPSYRALQLTKHRNYFLLYRIMN
jgi:hypothetical protein